MAHWILSGTAWVRWYWKKHSPTHTYCGHQSPVIIILHLLQSLVSSLFNLLCLTVNSEISLQVFFGLLLGLAPPLHTPYSIHLVCCFAYIVFKLIQPIGCHTNKIIIIITRLAGCIASFLERLQNWHNDILWMGRVGC